MKKIFLLHNTYNPSHGRGVVLFNIDKEAVKSSFFQKDSEAIKLVKTAFSPLVTKGAGNPSYKTAPFTIDGKVQTGKTSSSLYIPINKNYTVWGIYEVEYKENDFINLEPLPEAKFVGLLFEKTQNKNIVEVKAFFLPEKDLKNFIYNPQDNQTGKDIKYKFISDFFKEKATEKNPSPNIYPALTIEKKDITLTKEIKPFENLCDIILAETIKSYLL